MVEVHEEVVPSYSKEVNMIRLVRDPEGSESMIEAIRYNPDIEDFKLIMPGVRNELPKVRFFLSGDSGGKVRWIKESSFGSRFPAIFFYSVPGSGRTVSFGYHIDFGSFLMQEALKALGVEREMVPPDQATTISLMSTVTMELFDDLFFRWVDHRSRECEMLFLSIRRTPVEIQTTLLTVVADVVQVS